MSEETETTLVVPRVVDYGNAPTYTADTLVGLDVSCGITQLVFGLEQREMWGSRERTCNIQLRIAVPTARLSQVVRVLTGAGVALPEMFTAAHGTVN